jgi:hypothetical protein
MWLQLIADQPGWPPPGWLPTLAIVVGLAIIAFFSWWWR